MTWIVVASTIGFVASIVIVVSYFDTDWPDWIYFAGLGLTVISTITFIVCGIYEGTHNRKTKAIEYPASKYSIEIKVTEFQGNKDTTYVLIPKGL